MVVTSANGLILQVAGPFPAKDNDAAILRKIMVTPWFSSMFKSGDVFVLDRGFRDVKPELEAKGFRVAMPGLLNGRSQLPWNEANISSAVTKVRCVVEVRNRSLKRYQIFSDVVDNKNLPHLMDDLRITAAQVNAFEPRFATDQDDVNVATNILIRMNQPNTLQTVIETNSLCRARGATFQAIDMPNHLSQLTLMTQEDLKQLAGPYIRSLAPSYYADHLDQEHGIKIEVRKEGLSQSLFQSLNVLDPLLIRARLKSRHSGHQDYQAFILFDKSFDGFASVKGWYCQCLSGARTTLMCAHSFVVTWYLCYGRHQGVIRKPAQFLDGHFDLDVLQDDVISELENEQ